MQSQAYAGLSTRCAQLALTCVVIATTLVWTTAFAQDLSIGSAVRIDFNGGTYAANEISISSSESNPLELLAAFNDWRQSSQNTEKIRLGVAVSLDGGTSWDDFVIRPPEGFRSTIEGDAMTAFDDRTGTLWVGAISFADNGGIFVARKEPGSASLTQAVMAHVTADADKCWMAAGPRPGDPDSTRLYIAYNLGLIFSDDMGDTWSDPVALGEGSGYQPRIGPNGELYIAYWAGSDQMRILRSLDGGESFTSHIIASRMDDWGNFTFNTRFPGTFRVAPFVYIDVDLNDGSLYAVYFDTTEFIDPNYNVDLYFCKSTDQGSTWSVPRIINTDADPPGDQFFSWLEVDSLGRIHITFLDSRNTIQQDNAEHGMFDAYYMYSDDHGDSFEEFRLTKKSWDSDDDGLDRVSQFIGDYVGMTVAGTRVVPVFLDTSAGDSDIYANVIEFAAVSDLNGDGSVGTEDLLILLSNWGFCDDCAGPGDCLADLDGDCVVGTTDLLMLLSDWG